MQTAVKESLEKLLAESLSEEVVIVEEQTLSGGCINHATLLRTSLGDFFAKWNSEGPSDMFLREAECLDELARSGTSLLIPSVYVSTGREEGQMAFLVTSYLQPPQEQAGQDEALGHGIAELHQYEKQQFGFYHDNYCGATPQQNHWNSNWVDFFGRQRIWPMVERIARQGRFGSSEQQQYEQLMQKLPELIGHQPAPALNHGDLWSGNYMYTARGPAVIDPASYYADREFDLAMMAMFGGFGEKVWAAYQESYPLPQGWKDRRDLYMLYHYLNHYYLFGGGYGQQAMHIVKKYIS